jgi:hypothetical protein
MHHHHVNIERKTPCEHTVHGAYMTQTTLVPPSSQYEEDDIDLNVIGTSPANTNTFPSSSDINLRAVGRMDFTSPTSPRPTNIYPNQEEKRKQKGKVRRRE